MKKNKDGFVEFPATQVIGNQNATAQVEVKAGSEQRRKVQVKQKKRAVSADVVMLGEKIILELRYWFCFFIKFPIGIDVVSVECQDGEKIYCVRKWVDRTEQVYLVMDKQYFLEEKYKSFSHKLQYFLAQLLMSDICIFKSESKLDFYSCFADASENSGFADDDDEDAEDWEKFPGWEVYVYECARNYIEDVGLKIFFSNLPDIPELEGNKWELNGHPQNEYQLADIVKELPIDDFSNRLLIDLIDSVRDEVSFHPERYIEPKDDVIEKLLLVEALKADADTPEMMLPRKTDWVFPGARVDEDGFALNGSFYPSKK